MKHLISIIVPVYNVEKYLGKCIDSIVNQTYKNLELILVDDGATDQCPMLCDEYKQKDTRIKVIHQQNGGLSAARNAGIALAKGDYIAFVDSDDYIDSQMIEILYNRIMADASDLAICNITYVDELGQEVSELNYNMPVIDEIIDNNQAMHKLCENKWWYYITACNKLYKKELFQNIRFPMGKVNEDDFTVHYVFEQCKKISCVKMPLYNYVQRNGSIMNQDYSIKRLDGVEAYFDRTNFFLDKRFFALAVATLATGISMLYEGYMNLNKKDRNVSCRLKDLKITYNRIYKRIIKKQVSVNKKMLFTAFFMHHKFYAFLLKSKKTLRKTR